MANAERMPLIDALKGVASQIILLHHLALYGPLSLAVAAAFPDLADWLVDYGRMAVQVFLVIAGFLAARSLSPTGGALAVNPLPLIGRRYLRLALPFVAAISLAVAASALANQWLEDPAIPAHPTVGQWLAHAFLLHGVLGADSLSAGVWYVAIDFQLFVLLAILLWLGRTDKVAWLLVFSLATISLFWFNRDRSLDNWAIYFFGSYGLGAAAWWASTQRRMHTPLLVTLAISIIALLVEFRLRITIALATAMLIALSQQSGILQRWPKSRAIAFIGRISYSVFLVHFPALLLINVCFAAQPTNTPAVLACWLLFSWICCLCAGLAFHRYIEVPASQKNFA